MDGKLVPTETARRGHPTPEPTRQILIAATAPPHASTVAVRHGNLCVPNRDWDQLTAMVLISYCVSNATWAAVILDPSLKNPGEKEKGAEQQHELCAIINLTSIIQKRCSEAINTGSIWFYTLAHTL